jgi:plasmid maintenance system killer protein
MNRYRWKVLFGISLISLSVFFYFIQIEIFKSPRDTFFYLLQDIAFVPISVLMVTVIITEVLNLREKQSLLRKLNMVIGAFFSEVGAALLKSFPDFAPDYNSRETDLLVTAEWSNKEFALAKRQVKNHDYQIDCRKGDLEGLKRFLISKRDFLLRLLENPKLHEHRSFTNLLRAVFHLTEELEHRKDVHVLPSTDYEHLSGDIKRVYSMLLFEWLAYMGYLQKYYPYLFSLSVRTNPLDPNASPEVK